MAINYPGNPPGSGFDNFTTPSNPAGTPLSEAGTGTRNLTESVGDEGAAITALQQWAALRTHDHSGDGSGVGTGKKLSQTNTHENADTDSSPSSIHHTIDPLGQSPNKAAAANHVHDYTGATIVNKPLQKCTSINHPASPQRGDLIWEIDTNVMRVWTQFTPNDIADVGIYATDDFQRTDTTDLGPDWEQHYSPIDATLNPNGTAGGVMAIPDGANAQWVFDYSPYLTGTKLPGWPPSGWPWPYVQGRCIARRIKPADKHTLTDDQSITWQAGPTTMPFWSPWPPTPSTNDVYFRMSDDMNSWVRVSYTYTPGAMFVLWLIIIIIIIPLSQPSETVMVYYTTSGIPGETFLGKLSHGGFDPYSTYQCDFKGRTLSFYSDSQYIGEVVDKSAATAMGPSNRGWGFGMTVGRDPSWGYNYAHPTVVNQIWMRDIAYYTGNPVWQVLPVGAVPVVRVAQSVPQQLNHAGSLITWDTVEEDNFNFFNPAANTAVVCSEPGLYQVDCSIQWGQQYYPDVINVVLLLNGDPTTIKQQVTGPKQAGFSYTVSLSGTLRLAQNDMLQIFASYTSAANFWTEIFSYADVPSKTMSHLEITFISP